jgi:co-chaperonin GroES (HSP10)
VTPLQQEAHEIARKIKPTGDRVLVRLRKDMQKVGLVWLPDGGQSLDIVCSEVIAKGPDCKSRPWDFAPGDNVLHARVVGVAYDAVSGLLGHLSQNKQADYKILREHELLAVVAPESLGHVSGEASYDKGKTGTRSLASL